MQINAVNGLAAFNKTRDYLESLTTVTQIQPYQVAGDEVIFQLTTRSGRLGVEQAIALGATLVPEQPVVSTATNKQKIVLAPDLVYRLIQ